MSTGGDIDVTIPGSESSVDDAARWLEGLRDNASSAANLFAKTDLVPELGVKSVSP